MTSILVFVEQSKGQLKKATLSAFTLARELAPDKSGGEWNVVVLGHKIDTLAQQLKEYGPKKVFVADHPALENYLAQSYAQVIANLTQEINATYLIASVTAVGKDLMPRVAAKLKTGMVSDIIEAKISDGQLICKRPMYAGSAIATVSLDGNIKAMTVRGTAFEHAKNDPALAASSEIVKVNVNIDANALKMKFVSYEEHKSLRPELTEAPVVVSGGRGLKSKENFKLLEDLADLLGGAIGASRAAVDSGFVPNDLQVGQTGKVVAPGLYFAVAISGAIQHLAGMKDSKVIVAINKDPEAPIFQVADYGIVGDLFKVLPELIEEIKKVKA